MNVADSEQMKSHLKTLDYNESKSLEDADVVVINTCSVREKAEERLSIFSHNYKHLKKKKPHLLFGVTGCVAQQEGKKIIDKLPFIDFVLGPDNVHELPWVLNQMSHQAGKKIVLTEFDKEPRVWKTQKTLAGNKPTAFINVMKGCDHFCSYCIVPMTRGREKSRPIIDIVEDVKRLTDQGVKEITFLGQNINSFGKRADETLHELFYKIHDIEALKRIRFTTSHPGDLKDGLVQAYRDLPKLCSQFHLPVQSGSDRILRSMRRFYTIEHYLEKVDQLRSARPDIDLSTDIIVGFPGEEESDFLKTVELVKKVRFDCSFSFLYSPRPGTSAAKREDKTPMSVKKERLQHLQQILRKISEEEHFKLTGSTQEILIEGPSKKDKSKLTGRNSQNIPVHFTPSKEYQLGDLVNVHIVEGKLTHLRAEEIKHDRQRKTPDSVSASL